MNTSFSLVNDGDTKERLEIVLENVKEIADSTGSMVAGKRAEAIEIFRRSP